MFLRRRLRSAALFLCLLIVAISHAHASVALLMQGLYGQFGAIIPPATPPIISITSAPIRLPCFGPATTASLARSSAAITKIDDDDWIATPLGAVFTRSIRRTRFL